MSTSLSIPPSIITSFVARELPQLPTLDDGESYSTPSMEVPGTDKNPYILSTDDTNGTVFIAVGAIVGAILLSFIIYHLVRSVTASRMAKTTLASDKLMYEKYQNNNNNAYGLSTTSTLNNMGNQSIAKLPLLSHHPSRSVTGLGGGLEGSTSQLGDTSTLYQSEAGGVTAATSKHDLTKMFISPTAEVMTNKRARGSQFGGSTPNLASPTPATNRHSQLIPNLYVNNEINNSDYSISTYNQRPLSQVQSPEAPPHPNLQPLNSSALSPNQPPRSNRKTIPSMYLEDLIDE